MARAKNPRGSGAQLKRDLLAAADAILDRTGDPADVTVRGVAAAVGVSPNAVYLHFADRDALLAEIVIERFDVMRQTILDAVDGIDDPVAALRAGHRTYCELGLAHPGHYRLLFGPDLVLADPALRRRHQDVARAAFDTLVEGCRRCIDAGLVGAVQPEALANSIWAMEHGYVSLSMRRRAIDLGSPDAVLDAFLAAARVAPQGARRAPPA